jgi:hypothetical protein
MQEAVVPDGPLSEETIAEFLARCRSEWVAAGLGEHAPQDVLDQVASIVAASDRQASTAER